MRRALLLVILLQIGMLVFAGGGDCSGRTEWFMSNALEPVIEALNGPHWGYCVANSSSGTIIYHLELTEFVSPDLASQTIQAIAGIGVDDVGQGEAIPFRNIVWILNAENTEPALDVGAVLRDDPLGYTLELWFSTPRLISALSRVSQLVQGNNLIGLSNPFRKTGGRASITLDAYGLTDFEVKKFNDLETGATCYVLMRPDAGELISSVERLRFSCVK